MLTKNRSFASDWKGEDFLADLASRYPEVVEYYLGDGRNQIVSRLRDWDLVEKALVGPSFEDAVSRLAEIADAIGRCDPHFTYSVKVGLVDPVERSPQEVMARAHSQALGISTLVVGDREIECQVLPRYRAAIEDAEDRLRIRFSVSPQAARELFRAIEVGGDPVELDMMDFSDFEGPDVLHDNTSDPGKIVFHPQKDTTPDVLRLRVDGVEESVSIRITRTSLSPGTLGGTSEWRSSGGTLELTVVHRMHGESNFSIRLVPLGDRPISDCSDDVAFLWCLTRPCTLTIFSPDGPLDQEGAAAELSLALVERNVAAMLDALQVIQQHTMTSVRIPTTLTHEQFRLLIESAAFLAGLPTTEMLTTIEPLEFHPATLPDQDLFKNEIRIQVVFPVEEMDIGDQRVELQKVFAVESFCSVRVTSIEEVNESKLRLAVIPGNLPLRVSWRCSSADIEPIEHELHSDIRAHISLTTLVTQIRALRRGQARSGQTS
jgi:hypothetical protein